MIRLRLALALLGTAAVLAPGCGDEGSDAAPDAGGASGGGSGGKASSGGAAASGGASGSNTGGSKGAQGGSGGGTATGGAAGDSGAGGDAGHAGSGGDAGQAGDGGSGGWACGNVERCEFGSLGIDDNCNGEVDEGCPCIPGQASSCFKGDPSYLDTPGCVVGTQVCGEDGTFGPCVGGVHALAPDTCFETKLGCRALETIPYATSELRDGIGNFGDGAEQGSEVWEVTCPAGVHCPSLDPPSGFRALMAGEYSVTYTRSVGGVLDSCTFPLVVRAAGLRVELDWNAPSPDDGADLDLLLHRPGNTSPWSDSAVCDYQDCALSSFAAGADSLAWFAGPPAMPPAAVNWYLDPVEANNLCFSTRDGLDWQQLGLGCHNPRLDNDRIFCNPSIFDPNNVLFCGPENINVDFPPSDQWFRIGVHYYGSAGTVPDIFPRVKVHCGGALAADLTATFSGSQEGAAFWMVADVLFPAGSNRCVVQPLYLDAEQRTPYITTRVTSQATFGPAYPPLP